MQQPRITRNGRHQVTAGGKRRAHLWGRFSVRALFGLGVALALLTPVLGVGSYLASLLVAAAAVVVTATAPVRPAAAQKSTTRPPDVVRFASARGRREQRLPLSRARRHARRDRPTPRARV